MKNYSLLLIIILIVSGCGNSEKTLDEKKAILEKLQNEAESLSEKIRELDKEIFELDTSAHNKKVGRLVTILETKIERFQHFIEIHGTAESDLNVTVSSSLGGEVLNIFVTEGQAINKGELMVQLDDELIKKDIEDIQIALNLATTIYERQQALWSKKIGSEIQLLEAKNKMESISKKLTKAQTQLEKLAITAPINGTVENIQIKLGEVARPGYPLFHVVNLKKLKIKADAAESYIGSIKKGEKVLVTFPAIGLQKEAVITSVGNLINTANRTFRVELGLSNEDNKLKVNLLAIIKIVDYENDNVFVIPTHLIQYENKKKFIYLAKQGNNENIAKKRYVEIGKSYKGNTEILSGLQPKEYVIDAGYTNVVDGSLLDIKTEKVN